MAEKPAAAQPPATIAGPTTDVHEEGNLERKHEWESSERKSTARAWNSLFIVLHGGWLYAYKDQKHAKQVGLDFACDFATHLFFVHLKAYTNSSSGCILSSLLTLATHIL